MTIRYLTSILLAASLFGPVAPAHAQNTTHPMPKEFPNPNDLPMLCKIVQRKGIITIKPGFSGSTEIADATPKILRIDSASVRGLDGEVRAAAILVRTNSRYKWHRLEQRNGRWRLPAGTKDLYSDANVGVKFEANRNNTQGTQRAEYWLTGCEVDAIPKRLRPWPGQVLHLPPKDLHPSEPVQLPQKPVNTR